MSVGKHEVKDFEDLRSRVADYPPGKKVELRIERDGKDKTLTIELAQRPDSNGMASLRRGGSAPTPGQGSSGLWDKGGPRLGIEVEDGKRGITVRSVRPGTVAAELGLRPGDVLQRINDQKIERPQDVRAALRKSENRVKVTVKRGRGTHTAVVERY